MLVNIQCDYCQKDYKKELFRVNENKKLNNKNYCSLECLKNNRTTSVVLPCMFCGIETKRTQYEYLKSDKIFCSRSCSAKYYNPTTKTKTPKKCFYCNKNLKSRNTKYCSSACKQKKDSEVFLKIVENGESTGCNKWGNISAYLRNYLFEKYNNKCSECKWSIVNTFTNKIPLEVHHIDGDYKNNSMDNLKLLCPSCHSLTSNYRAKNKNNEARQKGNRGRKIIPI